MQQKVAVIKYMEYDAVMKYFWFLLVFVALPLNAEIYRWQDESGRIIYSDQPHANAEVVKISESTVYRPPEINNPPDTTQEQQGDQEYHISISSPHQDEALWANDGNVPVNVDLTPELNIEKGQKLLITLDGTSLAEPQASTGFTVAIIERGAHSISVSLIDRSGQVIVSSETVNFTVHRAHINNKAAAK